MAKQTKYGLGFSPLSMKNAKSHGFADEMVANKEVGMYGIATAPNKDIVSHEYMARTKYHLNSFVTRLIQDNTLGRLYKITVNDYFVTMITNGTTNLVQDSTVFINNGKKEMKGVRFNFDLDIFAPSSSALVHFTDVQVRIVMTLKRGSQSKQLTIEESILAINTTAYPIDFSGITDSNDIILTIDEITIIPGDSYDYNQYKMALYDILFVVV